MRGWWGRLRGGGEVEAGVEGVGDFGGTAEARHEEIEDRDHDGSGAGGGEKFDGDTDVGFGDNVKGKQRGEN